MISKNNFIFEYKSAFKKFNKPRSFRLVFGIVLLVSLLFDLKSAKIQDFPVNF